MYRRLFWAERHKNIAQSAGSSASRLEKKQIHHIHIERDRTVLHFLLAVNICRKNYVGL